MSTNRNQSPRGTFYKSRTRKNKKESSLGIFQIAIVVMGLVSCYTTTLGLIPMLQNQIISLLLAAALSLFMISIAFYLPQAYRNGTEKMAIWGYVAVALFSVLLNYNYIFGAFSAEKLLYAELTSHRDALSEMVSTAEGILEKDVEELELQVAQLLASRDEEAENNLTPGKGPIYREKDQKYRAKSSELEAKSGQVISELKNAKEESSAAIEVINKSMDLADPEAYRLAIPEAIRIYNKIASELMADLEGIEFDKRRFVNKDVGQLSHSMHSIATMFGRDQNAALIFGSLLLAFLIDFVVLFAIVVINRSTAKPEDLQRNRRSKNKRRTSSTFRNQGQDRKEDIFVERG